MRTEKLGFKEEEYLIRIRKVMHKTNNAEKNNDYSHDIPFKYVSFNESEMFRRLEIIDTIFSQFLIIYNLKAEDISKNINIICDILIKIDKYVFAQEIFNSVMVSELKEISVTAYYFIKYKPFTYSDDDINEKFALYLITCSIKELYGVNDISNISSDYYKELIYGFRNWNLSKEAVILIAGALAEKFK